MSSLARDPFEALGDPHRRSIVQTLAGREMSVGELADGLPISRPAVSRHLRLLKEAGLVKDRPDGVKRIYRLDNRGADEVRRYMERMWGDAVARSKSLL
jgi:DNA-binding transcriptional ArsR family regulator